MLENKMNLFEIFSKPEAVYFHSKYKFEPAIKQFKERDKLLEDIIKVNDEMSNFKLEADELQQQIAADTSPNEQRALCIKTNNLLKRYISRVLSIKDGHKKFPFSYGMRMILTDDEVKNNKDFFNELFNKHHIDYQI